MGKGWWMADVPCPESVCDELAAVLADLFGVGVQVQDNAVRLYLSAEKAASDWKTVLEKVVENFHASLGLPWAGAVNYGFCEDADWNARWKEGFKPLRVGRRLVITPTWESYTPQAHDVVLTLDPGMAFGTGHHETTRLCLEWLEDVMATWSSAPAPSLLDVGTGSGILALAGALLGFRPVMAVDNDADAIEIAQKNQILNPKAASVQFFMGTAENVPGRFAVVVANIQAGPLMAMADVLAQKVEPGGRLGLCGLLEEQVSEVTRRYEALGFGKERHRQAGPWVLVAMRCRA
ncbi:50S ribosomal protein L11 methyltransferase [Desulfosoma caldarium]|uniref:50S ribosomal protein L11 methyltransferase n=1 Tax=Desulfosoma caldarium TaxID=610254 RepID=UPI0014742806|nr:50S ribosomal protein L11 methyltransferase [Desulfosoma caldarium]